jgi:UDP-N-acetyl-D-glucosamine dehydrogenase
VAGTFSRLRRAITTQQARVCVVGQGYVGVTVAAAAARAGFRVDGVDNDAARIGELHSGQPVAGVRVADFELALETGRLQFGTDPAVVASADVVLVCVPTPVVDGRPDLSAVEDAGRDVAPHLRAGSLVVLESTTYPGTTERVLRPLLEAHGLRAGADFLLAYSPERVNPGDDKYGMADIPRIVGGLTKESTRDAADFYGQLVDQVHVVSSCRAAELAKLLENTFRMVNIALVNELAVLSAEQGIDLWEVIDAAATKPFGFMPFFPGPGVGGHCIPLDPTYLSWQARRDTGRPLRLVETAHDVNGQMPAYVVSRVTEALSVRGTTLNGARVLAIGVTFKPNVGDIRESAAVEVLDQLRKKGARVAFHDPFVERIARGELRLKRVALTERALREADCVLLLTPHDSYDLELIVSHAPLVFDTRNATRDVRGANVVVL